MTQPATLEVSELPLADCRELLTRNHLGRIAFSFHDRVDVQPIFYVFDGDWIFGRTSAGEKLSTLRHHRWVAFQVDEVQDQWHWSSVVARGAFHELHPEGTPEEERVYSRARELVQKVMPEAFTEDDPASHRSILFGIAPQEITGRRARLEEG